MTCTSVKLFQIGLFGQRVQLWRCRLKRIWALVWVEYICYDFSFIPMLFISLSYLLHHHPIFLLMTYLIRLLVVCISSFSYSLHFYPILSASIYHSLWLVSHSSTCKNTCCFPALYFSLFLLKYSKKSFLVPPGLPHWKVSELPMYFLYQSTYIHYNQYFFINKAAHTLYPP